jgi:hypothetical protein
MELTCYGRTMRTVLVVLALLTSVAAADVHTSKVGKVSIEIPKKWSVNAKDELVRAASPDNQVAFVFWVVDSPDVKAALGKLESELYSSIQGLRWVDKTKPIKIRTIVGTWVEGVGVSSRQTQLDVLVVVAGPTPTKKGVILLAVVDHDKLTAHQKTIKTIFETLKTTK